LAPSRGGGAVYLTKVNFVKGEKVNVLPTEACLVFSSHEFILIFLPIALAGYFGLRLYASKSITLFWLIAASLAFYSVWDPRNLLILFASICFNFACGSLLAERARDRRPTRLLLGIGVAFNLGLLGYFKYAGFFATNLNAIFGTHIPVLDLVLPLAISFFTFQEIAYLVDSSRGETQGYRFKDYVLMVSFFPHLIAGPIVNHRILMRQFMSTAPLRTSPETFALGVSFFVFGLTKKVLLADSVAPQANILFDGVAKGGSPTLAESWIGTLAYTLQLYFDFSGYSDMAIGLGLLFGIRLPLNFNSPYKATNIVDFWRRWHMTLSAFLRDYLYFALGGNRRGKVRRYANLILTMVLGGLWHGAGWTFICWGALHGIGLAACHFWHELFGTRRWSLWRTAVARAFTLMFVIFGWVIFRADSMDSALTIIAAMTGFNGFDLSVDADRKLTVLITILWIAGLMAITQLAPNTQQWLGYDADRPAEEAWSWGRRLATHPLHGAMLGCLFVFILTQMSAVQSFLYFQF
jgi:alginate O-acetyltransferase complex protein AlgI